MMMVQIDFLQVIVNPLVIVIIIKRFGVIAALAFIVFTLLFADVVAF